MPLGCLKGGRGPQGGSGRRCLLGAACAAGMKGGKNGWLFGGDSLSMQVCGETRLWKQDKADVHLSVHAAQKAGFPRCGVHFPSQKTIIGWEGFKRNEALEKLSLVAPSDAPATGYQGLAMIRAGTALLLWKNTSFAGSSYEPPPIYALGKDVSGRKVSFWATASYHLAVLIPHDKYGASQLSH